MQERGLADHATLLDQAADPDADARETRVFAGQLVRHLREQVGDLSRVVVGQGPVVAGDDLAPEGGDDAVDHVLGDLEADEGAGLGDDVEGCEGRPWRTSAGVPASGTSISRPDSMRAW